jgi:adenylate cyclase
MVPAKRLRQTQLFTSFLATALVIGAVALGYHGGIFSFFDHIFSDLRVHWRGVRSTSGNILLVLMDETSARTLKRKKGTWSRLDLIQALNNLHTAGAEIVGLDMVLFAPDTDPTIDTALADTIDKCNNVVLARVASAHGKTIQALPQFQHGMVGDGFIDFPQDQDEVLRRVPFFNAKRLDDGSIQLLPSFSLELVRAYLNIDFSIDFSVPDTFRIGSESGRSLRLPYPELIIDFYGNYKNFAHLSYADIVLNQFDPEVINGKLVIIGSSLAVEEDLFTTPFSRFHSIGDEYKEAFGTIVKGRLGAKDIGVACHAHAADTILRQTFITPLSRSYILGLIIAIGLLAMVLYLPRIGLLWEVLFFLTVCGVIVGGGYLLFLVARIDVDITPLLTVLSLQLVSGLLIQEYFNRQKTNLVTQLFGKYVSPSVVDELIKGDLETTLAGHRRSLTVLFSDLRRFTTLSERLGPKKTTRLLNTYFDEMIPLVFKRAGTLDKLMGDAIMAFFGAPVALTDHPSRAASTALEMTFALSRLKQAQTLPGIENLNLGIGLNTGQVTVGNLGSQEFMDYTIIGDAVNLASRLEGLNKTYGTRIIISEFTAAALDKDFCVRKLDRVQVKGKKESVTILELMGFTEQMAAVTSQLIDAFEAALDAYAQRQWHSAQELLKQVLALSPQDGPSLLYLRRIEEFKKTPPPEGWHGETVFDHK